MNKKTVVFVVTLILAMLATPVLAIGPQNAESNPNVSFPSYGVALDSPSGMQQEWVNGIDKHLMWMDARAFHRNAFVVKDISHVAEKENDWLFFSAVIYGDWLTFVLGATPGTPQYIGLHMWALSNFPEGVYYREVLVGK
jgi:hypothetical protein